MLLVGKDGTLVNSDHVREYRIDDVSRGRRLVAYFDREHAAVLVHGTKAKVERARLELMIALIEDRAEPKREALSFSDEDVIS